MIGKGQGGLSNMKQSATDFKSRRKEQLSSRWFEGLRQSGYRNSLLLLLLCFGLSVPIQPCPSIPVVSISLLAIVRHYWISRFSGRKLGDRNRNFRHAPVSGLPSPRTCYKANPKRDAQRQYVVIGTLAPIIIECLFLRSDWGSGPEGGDVLLNQGWNKWGFEF